MTETREINGNYGLEQSEVEYRVRRWMLVGARVLSAVFRPNYYPTVIFILFLNFTFLRHLPVLYRLYVLLMVFLFTYAIPLLGVWVYRKARGLSRQQLRERRKRLVPYAIHIFCYLLCLYFVWRLSLPSFMMLVIVISICLQYICALITLWWKISMHSAAVGATIGGLAVYASLFGFNPVWWLCGLIILSGLVNTSRMLLRQHTLWQVLGGTWIGIGCGLLGISLL